MRSCRQRPDLPFGSDEGGGVHVGISQGQHNSLQSPDRWVGRALKQDFDIDACQDCGERWS